jgi:hypothetical protein
MTIREIINPPAISYRGRWTCATPCLLLMITAML